jgi:hypothetical protein
MTSVPVLQPFPDDPSHERLVLDTLDFCDLLQRILHPLIKAECRELHGFSFLEGHLISLTATLLLNTQVTRLNSG